MPASWADSSILGLLGLIVGSFLNVVVYRLPKMLEARWAADCADSASAGSEARSAAPAEVFNLVVPRSACPSCGHKIRWFENIPVISFAVLRGKCSACGASIGLRYPAVELATGALFAYCGWRWGLSVQAIVWCGFSATLLTLAVIDWDTTLLPDDMTLPLVWSGLIVSALRLNPLLGLADSLWGAIAGYLSLWTVYWGFKLLTGKEGMGYGDFKLFAALGAWFGWQALIPIILVASVIGACAGIAMKFTSGLREGGYVPFGPFLAGSGFSAMIFGPDAVLKAAGF